MADFHAGIDEVNRLVERGEFDQALKVLDRLIPGSDEETRVELERYRDKLARTAASNKAIDTYNAGIAFYNKRDYNGALAAFEKAARESPDPELTKAAKAKTAEVKALLSKKTSTRP